MIFRLNLEETYETRQSISIEVLTERELTGTEKAALVAFAQAHVSARAQESGGVKPAPKGEWDMELPISSVKNQGRTCAACGIIGLLRPHGLNARWYCRRCAKHPQEAEQAAIAREQDNSSPVERRDRYHVVYSATNHQWPWLHEVSFEVEAAALAEGERLIQEQVTNSYMVYPTRNVPSCSNTARCPCCQNNVIENELRFLEPPAGQPVRGMKYCQSCLPIIGRAVEIVGKREETRAKQGD